MPTIRRSLPVATERPLDPVSIPGLPRVVLVERTGSTLHPTPQIGPDVLGVNLARGCGMRCGFCSVRSSPSYPGDEAIYLYRGTALQLGAELAARAHRPRAVYISPATDPFPPIPEVQAETGRIVSTLAAYHVPAWIMTRGHIRAAVREVLARHAELVTVTIPITTVHRGTQRAFEPWTASPRARLRQIRELKRSGVKVLVAIEPLIPGVTDTPENLVPLLKSLADAGVSHVTTGYLFLRPGITDKLRPVLEPWGGVDLLEEVYRNGPLLHAPGIATARYLPRARRQRGYAAMMALASVHDITVSVSRTLNPDFQPAAAPPEAPAQRLLPMFLRAGPE